MTTLRIADNLVLPEEAVTQTLGFIGIRGSGKSYAASVFVEELLGARHQVVVIDPLDAWWGLRSSADGKSAGLPIVIAGGDHGDIPLDGSSGSVLADIVVEDRVPMVLSLRHLSKTKQRTFVAEFCERLYHRKGEAQHRTPLHVAIDEADAFVPQRVMGDTARVMGAVDDLVRRGRSSGFGISLITQRPAVIHKDVLTQIEALVAFRITSPQDRKALDAWIEQHDIHDQRGPFLESLASLPIGTAWFWSPGWLDTFERVKIRRRETFDSSSTPKVGQQRAQPSAFADVDLAALRDRIEATIERAAAEDPTALKKRVAELERQLAKQVPVVTVERIEVPVEVPVLDERTVARLVVLLSNLTSNVSGLAQLAEELTNRQGQLKALLTKPAAVPAASPRTAPTPARRQPNGNGLKLKLGERRMLQVLARMHPRSLTRLQLATLSSYSVKGGTYLTYLGTLKRSGVVEETHGGLVITEHGFEYLNGDYPASPVTADELLAAWKENLKLGERKMLDELVRVYPRDISRPELAEATDFTASGGTFLTYLGTLRRNGLIEDVGGQVRASDTLFMGVGVSR